MVIGTGVADAMFITMVIGCIQDHIGYGLQAGGCLIEMVIIGGVVIGGKIIGDTFLKRCHFLSSEYPAGISNKNAGRSRGSTFTSVSITEEIFE